MLDMVTENIYVDTAENIYVDTAGHMAMWRGRSKQVSCCGDYLTVALIIIKDTN